MSKTSVKKVRTVQQNMLFNTVGSLIYYVCQWLMSVIIVRLSGFGDAGLLSLAMSATAAPAIIGLFNVRSYQVSDMKGQYTDKEYLRSRVYTNILSVIACLAVVLYYGYSIEKAVIIMTFMGFKVVEGMADVYYGIDQKNERMDYAGISLTVRGIGSLAVFLGTFILSGNLLAESGTVSASFCTSETFFVTARLFVSIVAMSLFSLAVVLVYDRRVIKYYQVEEVEDKAVMRAQVKSLLLTCFPLAVVSFLNNMSLTIPKLYLEQYFGEEIMGIYSSVASPTIVIQLAATTLFAPLIPPLTIEFNNGNKKKFLGGLKKFALLILAITVAALIGSKLLAHWGLVLLFGTEIEPYVYLFIPVIVISILIAINASMFSICTLIREIKSQYLIGVFGILAAVAGSLTLVKEYSMDGVVWALAATLLIQILIQFIIIYRKVRKM